MACIVEQNGNIYDDNEDLVSETSTMRCYSYGNSDKIHRCIKSENLIQNEIYRSKDFDINSDNEHDEESFITDHNCNSTSLSFMKFCQIDISPEAEAKRRESFNKWIKIVNEREKERKKIQREKIEAERLKRLEEEEMRKLQNDEKIKEWNERKRREVQRKMFHLNEMKLETDRKLSEPKEFRRAIRFDEWVARKNEELKKVKVQQKKEQKILKDYMKKREDSSILSYKKWMQTSKNVPKPVPLNRGLDSLRGSTSKLYENPVPWKSALN